MKEGRNDERAGMVAPEMPLGTYIPSSFPRSQLCSNVQMLKMLVSF